MKTSTWMLLGTAGIALLTVASLGTLLAARDAAQPSSPLPSTRSAELLAEAARLRQEEGPRALQILLGQREAVLEQMAGLHSKKNADEPSQPTDLSSGVKADKLTRRLRQLEQKIDAVGAQRYCWKSGLYWYTDLTQAQARARETGKPILCLRLLGKLTDQYSCANSRFFRTTLYADKQVAKYLRDHFVLYWETVRPVPQITIDFGNGRVVRRTLTGNSIHYVLDSEGQPIDGLPGLYGPQAFLRGLQQAEAAERAYRQAAPKERAAVLQRYHRGRLVAIRKAWTDDLRSLDIEPPTAGPVSLNTPTQQRAENRLDRGNRVQPTVTIAERANLRAMPKGRVELPLLRGLDLARSAQDAASRQWLETTMTDALWQRIAQLHHEDAQLSSGSREVIRQENPTAVDAGRLAVTKYIVEDPLVKMIRNLENSIAVDTVRNEYLLHYQLHEWFSQELPREMQSLNRRVYAKLFLTPDSDPWLGLIPEATYTGLSNGGRVQTEN